MKNRMRLLLIIVLFAIPGCKGKLFTDLGNGTAVPRESIETYAEEHGLTPKQARKAMLAEDQAKKQK